MHSLLDIVKFMKKIIAIIFILLGVLIILYPKISNIIEEKNQTEVIKEYKNKIEKTNDEEKNKAYKKGGPRISWPAWHIRIHRNRITG